MFRTLPSNFDLGQTKLMRFKMLHKVLALTPYGTNQYPTSLCVGNLHSSPKEVHIDFVQFSVQFSR